MKQSMLVGTLLTTPLLFGIAQAENLRGSTTGPTHAKGYDHPNQYIHLQPTTLADNMEPVIVHKEQEKAAREKLKAFEKINGKKPNIMFVLLDDVGWSDLGFNGGGTAFGNPTPNIDKFAHEGVVFSSAYSTPSCSPTRATIMTGQNPLHHGILRPPMYGEKGGLDGGVTVASVLKKLGYYTQGIGKWHIGENESSQPQNVGFDDYYGYLSVSDMYTEWRDMYFNPEVVLSPARFKMMEKEDFIKYNVHCTPKEGVEKTYLIDLDSIRDLEQDWATYGEKFIKKMADSKKPWFLYYCTRGAHFDNYPNDEYAGKSPARTVYSDSIVELDDVFGRLTKALEESGQLENTIIILGSDNGPEQEIPPHGRTLFRGGKGSSWEGGVRVPTFVYWKGMIKPRKTDGLFDYADFFNTFISIAGKPGAEVAKLVPEKHYIDGVDQSSFWLADNGQSCRYSRIYTLNQHFSAVRMDEFKYIFVYELQKNVFPSGYQGGFSGSIITDTGGTLMVNLYTDPKEDVTVGVRHLPLTVPLMAEKSRYEAVLEKYPPQIKIGF
jgi:arylsulfatase